MSDDGENAVLTQDDIDALIAQRSPSDDAPAQGPAPDSPPASGSQPTAQIIPAVPGGEELAKLAPRVAKLEKALTQPGADVQALAQQVRALSARLEEILQHLPNTLGYGARSSFQCGGCGAQGYVASRVMCTHCNTETHIGWWPQQT